MSFEHGRLLSVSSRLTVAWIQITDTEIQTGVAVIAAVVGWCLRHYQELKKENGNNGLAGAIDRLATRIVEQSAQRSDSRPSGTDSSGNGPH